MPYTVQLKMIMHDLCSEENKVQWDDPAPSNVFERFKQVIGGLSDLRNISFPRSIQPSQEHKGPPMLLVLCNGSLDTYCAIAYAHWELMDGSVECWLISRKSRVTPRIKMSIPCIELMESLMAI